MPKIKKLRKLCVYDIQRILYWTFNLSKRPSFLPLRAKDRPFTINLITIQGRSTNIQKILTRFKINNTAHVNENIPFDMIVNCILKDGEYNDIIPSFKNIKMENLKFIPMMKSETVHSSGLFVDDSSPQIDIDFNRYRRAHKTSEYDIIALDVEKVETTVGKELGRVTIVDSNGNALYDRIIKPRNPVTNYLTRYSGLTEQLLIDGIDIEVMKNDVMDIIGTNTVILGHGIENDLSSLELYHDKIIDTAHLFLNPEGRKISLAQLSRIHLNKTIHINDHDSKVDAITCLELLSIKIQHILNITSGKSPDLKIDANVMNKDITEIIGEERGYLNLTTCTHEELTRCARTYKRNREYLWMFVYQVNDKVYLSF